MTRDFIASQITQSQQTLAAMAADQALQQAAAVAAAVCVASLRSGGKILLAGNGGSAADAQHMAGEYVRALTALLRVVSAARRAGLGEGTGSDARLMG